MTETSGPHTVFPTLENLVELPEAQRGSFGPPIAGMEHLIVDPETGAPVADGDEGEIFVRGEHLMEACTSRSGAERSTPTAGTTPATAATSATVSCSSRAAHRDDQDRRRERRAA